MNAGVMGGVDIRVVTEAAGASDGWTSGPHPEAIDGWAVTGLGHRRAPAAAARDGPEDVAGSGVCLATNFSENGAGAGD